MSVGFSSGLVKCLAYWPQLRQYVVSGKLQDVIEDCLFDFKNEDQPLSVCVAQILAACADTKGVQAKSSFPMVYDKAYEKTISEDVAKLQRYWAHLRTLGWKKVDGA